MRLFVAIELPDELKKGLARLRTDIPGARWVPAEQIHLTLAFLGETDGEITERLKAGLAMIQADAFELSWGGLGCFPDWRRPRVVWAGVKPEPNLFRLAAAVHQAVRATGINLEERPFSPHITLARLKLPTAAELGLFLGQQRRLTLQRFSVQEFTLFQSSLTSQGAVHSPIRIFPLRTA